MTSSTVQREAMVRINMIAPIGQGQCENQELSATDAESKEAGQITGYLN